MWKRKTGVSAATASGRWERRKAREKHQQEATRKDPSQEDTLSVSELAVYSTLQEAEDQNPSLEDTPSVSEVAAPVLVSTKDASTQTVTSPIQTVPNEVNAFGAGDPMGGLSFSSELAKDGFVQFYTGLPITKY